MAQQHGHHGQGRTGERSFENRGRAQAAALGEGLEARCRDLMKSSVECVEPGDSIAEAARRMRDRNVGFLPVCESDGRVLGTITDRDITVRATALAKNPAECPVREVMSHDLVACRPDDDVAHAERLMSEYQKSRLLITDDDGLLVGVISLSDIAQRESYERTTQVLRQVSSRESHT